MPVSLPPSTRRFRIAAAQPAAESGEPVGCSRRTREGRLRAGSVRRATRNEEPKFCEAFRKEGQCCAVRRHHSETPGAPPESSQKPPSPSARMPLGFALPYQRKRQRQGRREKSGKAKPR